MKLRKSFLASVCVLAMGWSSAASAQVMWDEVYSILGAVHLAIAEQCANDPDPETCTFYARQAYAGNAYFAAYMYPEYSDERDTLLMVAILLSN